ncbi:MAG: peptide chain release factor-like protein [Candidatus Hydrogenedentes bacterium]|nr:peptide chain release factor-like protein [Candidatus Hydrogenedentota bacterium]
MGKFGVSPKKEAELLDRMKDLNIEEKDLEEKFITARGPGGQKSAHSSTGVYLKHIPTQIEVKIDISRSLALNRFLARRRLCELIELKLGVKDSPLLNRIKKLRKQKLKKRKRAYAKYKKTNNTLDERTEN